VKAAKALSLALVLSAAALLTIAAGAAGSKTLHFKVVSATASAKLTFHTANKSADETSDGTVLLIASAKTRAKGSIPGHISFPLKGHVKERVTTKQRVSTTSPYQETCSNIRKLAGRGGLKLTRVGSKVNVRWAFPQANPSFCHGPKVTSNVTSRMKRAYTSKALSGKHVTIVLSGSAKVPGESSSLTYRWHAVVKLSRS
jgi:hypothetical protein